MSRDTALVTADWVEEHLDDPKVVLIEVDEDVEAYDKGHIPGAIKLDWKKDLQDGVRHDFISKEKLEKLLSEKGVANDDTVVFYGGNNNWFAAYAYWYLTYYGHENLRLLDGGRKKWELDSRELSSDVPDRPATTYTAQEPNEAVRAYRDEVVEAIGSKNLIDVRSPDEYAIPTAGNVPWSKAANDDGTFKKDEELKALYADAGLDEGKDTIAYCRIGERSSHTWFVLNEILGYPNVKNYDGSWVEYGSLVGAPIELGA